MMRTTQGELEQIRNRSDHIYELINIHSVDAGEDVLSAADRAFNGGLVEKERRVEQRKKRLSGSTPLRTSLFVPEGHRWRHW